jgi:hypothetical protein
MFDCVNAVVMRAPPFDVVTVRRDELTRKGHVLLDKLEGTESSKTWRSVAAVHPW